VKSRQIAEKWSKTNNFKLIDSNAVECRLIFNWDSVSFYILCHDGGQGRWNVWSEDGRVLKMMTAIQDFVHACKKRSLDEVLNFIQDALTPLAQGEVDEAEGACAAAPIPVRAPPVVDDDVDEGLAIDDDDPSYRMGDSSSDDGGYDASYYDGDADLDDNPRPGPSHQQSPGANMSISPQSERFFSGNANAIACHRILKDLKSLQASEGEFGVKGLPRGDNLLIWDVGLAVPPESQLGEDLKRYSKVYMHEAMISMEMEFPPDYPMSPPFVRVLRPRIKFLTGHVTIGGSVCMEMLTKSGWRPTNDIESILVQIRSEILSDPKTRIDFSHGDREYDKHEAKVAFQRMVQKYGWSS